MTNTTCTHTCREHGGTTRGIHGGSPTSDRSPSDWRRWDDACRHGVSAEGGTRCDNCDCEACHEIDRWVDARNLIQMRGEG